MQIIQKILAALFSRAMLAFLAMVLLALMVWFVGPLLAVEGLRPLASVAVRVSIIVLVLAWAILWLSKLPLHFIGVACVCLLVWNAGPLLSLSSARPLAPVWVRTLIIGLVVVAYALYGLFRLLQAMKKDPDQLSALLNWGPTTGKNDSAKEQIKTLSGAMDRAIAELKKLRGIGGLRRLFEGKRYLYELPWYMIIGNSAAGKTTALRNSGLQFPLARRMGNLPQRTVLGTHSGTMNCDWWIANEAVLIDTAGRYVTHDSNAQTDPAEWGGFLGLLRQHRTRAPINGAIVALNAWELRKMNASERAEHASLLRERLAELRQELGIRFPVYVVVTKMDLLLGFDEYFQSLTSEGRTQTWGFTLPYHGSKVSVANEAIGNRDALRSQVRGELARLKDRLSAGLRSRLSEEFDVERRRKLFALPQEFAGLSAPLLQVLEEVFLDSRFDRTQWHSALRGVYFTSGAQSDIRLPADPGTLLQRLRAGLSATTTSLVGQDKTSPPAPGAAAGVSSNASASDPGERSKRIDTGPIRSQQGFFLQDLLTKVIIPEAHLVRPNLRWEFRFRLLRLLGHALALVIFLWLAGALLLSFGNNRQYLNTVDARAQVLSQQVTALFARFRPDGVAEVLNAARELPGYTGLDPDNPPGSFLYGLYSVPPVLEESKQSYAQLQDKLLLPPILARMEAVLAQSVKARDANNAYATLRVYKLLHDKERYMKDGGARDVRDWVLKDWQSTDSAAVFGGLASMVDHVQTLFSGDRPVQAASLPNEALVREVQSFLDSNTSTQRVYERAKTAMLPEAPQEFTLVRAVGPQAGAAFSRAAGLPLEKGVPGLFTYDGYHQLVNKRLPEFVGRALADDAWVMGRSTGSETAIAQKKTLDDALGGLQASPLLEDVRRQYLAEYAQNWEVFLDSVRIVGDITTGAAGTTSTTATAGNAGTIGTTSTSLGFDLSVLRQFAAPDSPLARLGRAAARETTLSRPLVTTAQEDKSLLDKAGDLLNQKTNELNKSLGLRGEARLEKQLVDNRFAALREVVTGQPDVSLGGSSTGAGGSKPGLDALSGLLNEFYTVLVVADTALTANSLPPGGTEVGGKLKLEAGKLPAPFRAVLTALATSGSDKVMAGSTDILRKQAQVQLDRIMGLMAMQVSEPCKRGVEGRYPMAAVAQDASIEDFTQVFAVGGAADEFFTKYLAPFADTGARPWRYKSPDSANAMVGVETMTAGASPAPATTGPTLVGELLKLLAKNGPNLDAFSRAQQVRELFFKEAGGRKFSWKMEIKVLELEPSITDLIIDIDGQGQRYVHGPVQPFSVNWPGPRGGAMAELTANPRVSAPTSTLLTSGPWALFRLLEKGRVVGTATPGRQSIEFAFDGRKALLDISSGSQPNPLNSDVLKGFRCPGRAS